MSGSSELTLELTDIVINGTAYPLLTSTYEVKGKGEGGKTAKKVVGGRAWARAGRWHRWRWKRCRIGAAAGAAGGTAIAASKKGEQLQIPSESLSEFRLEQTVALPAARAVKQLSRFRTRGMVCKEKKRQKHLRCGVQNQRPCILTR